MRCVTLDDSAPREVNWILEVPTPGGGLVRARMRPATAWSRRQRCGWPTGESCRSVRVTGRLPAPFGISSAAKAAMAAVMDAYRMELRPHGVDVVIAEPYSMRTGGPTWSASPQAWRKPDVTYTARRSRRSAMVSTALQMNAASRTTYSMSYASESSAWRRSGGRRAITLGIGPLTHSHSPIQARNRPRWLSAATAARRSCRSGGLCCLRRAPRPFVRAGTSARSGRAAVVAGQGRRSREARAADHFNGPSTWIWIPVAAASKATRVRTRSGPLVSFIEIGSSPHPDASSTASTPWEAVDRTRSRSPSP
jgi:hypothetical protein